MNEIIEIAIAAIIVMGIGCPIAIVLDKCRKEMGEGDKDEDYTD